MTLYVLRNGIYVRPETVSAIANQKDQPMGKLPTPKSLEDNPKCYYSTDPTECFSEKNWTTTVNWCVTEDYENDITPFGVGLYGEVFNTQSRIETESLEETIEILQSFSTFTFKGFDLDRLPQDFHKTLSEEFLQPSIQYFEEDHEWSVSFVDAQRGKWTPSSESASFTDAITEAYNYAKTSCAEFRKGWPVDTTPVVVMPFRKQK